MPKLIPYSVDVRKHEYWWDRGWVRVSTALAVAVCGFVVTTTKNNKDLVWLFYCAGITGIVLAVFVAYMTYRAQLDNRVSTATENLLIETCRNQQKLLFSAMPDPSVRATMLWRVLQVVIESLFDNDSHYHATLLVPQDRDGKPVLIPTVRYEPGKDFDLVVDSKAEIPRNKAPAGRAWDMPGFVWLCSRMPRRARREGIQEYRKRRRRFFEDELSVPRELHETFSERTLYDVRALACIAITNARTKKVLMVLAIDAKHGRDLRRLKARSVRWVLGQAGIVLAHLEKQEGG